jgi:hypothetical protein
MAKATQKFEKKLTGITLELTVEEAKQIQVLVGKTCGDSLYSVYHALYGVVGYADQRYNVFDGAWNRVDLLTVKERN